MQPEHGFPAKAHGTGGIFLKCFLLIFYLLFRHKASFIFLPPPAPPSLPGLQLSTRDDDDDVNANDDVTEKQGSPSPSPPAPLPLIRHDLLGFFFLFTFRCSSSSPGRRREVAPLEDSIDIAQRRLRGRWKKQSTVPWQQR